jgi:spoIIIJ-associated protein
MDETTTTLIKKTIETLLEKMGFAGTVSLAQADQDDLVYTISTDNDNSHLLIGQYGVNLQALQHLARLIVRKQLPEKIHFSLDINDYRQQKNQSVIELAHAAAKEAIDKHYSVVMHPMSSYERRLVHVELLKNSAIVTESIGEGVDRKIVVKPADLPTA